MERRAGHFVEKVSKMSTNKAAKESFQQEMEDVGINESLSVRENMGPEVEDLGVSALPDASPLTSEKVPSFQKRSTDLSDTPK